MNRSKRTYGVVKPFSSRTSKHHRAKSDDKIICSCHEYGTKTKDDDDDDREQREETKRVRTARAWSCGGDNAKYKRFKRGEVLFQQQ